MTKEQEQSLREWIARELDKYLESSVVDGRFSPYSYADTILAEVNRRLEKSALTPEQIHVLSNCEEVCNDGCCGCNYACSIAAAQLNAVLEVLE